MSLASPWPEFSLRCARQRQSFCAVFLISLSLGSSLGVRAEQALDQTADDPTAALMNIQLADWYTPSYHNLNNEDSNQFVVRSAIPFKVGSQQHIFRVTLPFITDSPFRIPVYQTPPYSTY